MEEILEKRKGILSVLKDYHFNSTKELTHLDDLLKIGNKLKNHKKLTKKDESILDSARLYDTQQSYKTEGGIRYGEVSFTDVYNKLNCTDFYENEIVQNFCCKYGIPRPTSGYAFAQMFCLGYLNANLVSEELHKRQAEEKADQFVKDSDEGSIRYEPYELDWDKHKCNNFRNSLDKDFFSHFKSLSHEGNKAYLYVDNKRNTVYDLNFKINATNNSITFNASSIPSCVLEELNRKIASSVNQLRAALKSVNEIDIKTDNLHIEELICPTDYEVKPIAPFFILTTFFDIKKKFLCTETIPDGSNKPIQTQSFLGLVLSPKLKGGYYRPNGYALHLFNSFENFSPYIEEFLTPIPKLSNDLSAIARTHLSLESLGLNSRFTTKEKFLEHMGKEQIDENTLRSNILEIFKKKCPELHKFYQNKLTYFSLFKRMHFNGQIIDETNTTADTLVLAGEGGDGKSTDVHMLEMWLNDQCPQFAGTLDWGVIASGELGNLTWWNHRLLTLPEVPESLYHNNDFKKISGGDTFVKPVKYQSPRVISGKGTKIIMTTNDKIVADDQSIRRRLIVLYYKNSHHVKDEFTESDLKNIVDAEYTEFMKLCWRFYCLSNSTKRNGGMINYCEEDYNNSPSFDSEKPDALLSIRAITCDEELKMYPKGILTGDFSDSDTTMYFNNVANTFLKIDSEEKTDAQDLMNEINAYLASPNPTPLIVFSIANAFELKVRKINGRNEYEPLTGSNRRWFLFRKHLKTNMNVNEIASTKRCNGTIVAIKRLLGCKLLCPSRESSTLGMTKDKARELCLKAKDKDELIELLLQNGCSNNAEAEDWAKRIMG